MWKTAIVELLEDRTLLSSTSANVFDEANMSILQDAGKAGLPDVTVRLDASQNRVLETGEVTIENAHVIAVDVNGSDNRAGLRSITYQFDQPVTVAGLKSLRLFNHTSAMSVDISAATLSGNGTTTLMWDFMSLNLPNAQYSAELPADQVTTASNGALAVTHAITLHVLAGDANGNASVSFDDYGTVQANFAAIVDPFGDGDANGDGRVSFDDYGIVQASFADSLPEMSFDFGDVLDSATFPTTLANDGARHVITGNDLYLGAARDAEPDGQPAADASGDGDDDDGIFTSSLNVGTTVPLRVFANVPATAVLNAWIDFNRDGDWDDPGEHVFDDVPVVTGTNDLSVAVPADAVLGATFARFRITESAGYTYSGLAPNGEVEDYQLTIADPVVPQIVLGPSDNIALDQPRVTVLLTEDLEGTRQVGPSFTNEWLLDTGSNSILAYASSVSELVDGPYSYQTEGLYEEFGVGGPTTFDIGSPYYFYFAANGNEYVPPPPLPETRILSNPNEDLSIFGPYGIAGMPLMEGRVVTYDFSGWSGGLLPDLSNLYMQTAFSDTLPAEQNRYTVSIDNRISFDAEDGIIEGDHPPIWSDIPFLTAILGNQEIDRPGNFLFDTGGQASILSESVAFDLNLDSNGDNEFNELDANYVDTLVIGGVGGQIEVPMFFVEEVRIPTEEGPELVLTNLGWLILDIDVGEGQPPLDGVFGMDNLTSGWVNTIFENGPDGYFQQVHLDFRDWSNGTGAIYFDLTTTQAAARAADQTPTVSPLMAATLAQTDSLSLIERFAGIGAGEPPAAQANSLDALESVAPGLLPDLIPATLPSRPLDAFSRLEQPESPHLSLVTTASPPSTARPHPAVVFDAVTEIVLSRSSESPSILEVPVTHRLSLIATATQQTPTVAWTEETNGGSSTVDVFRRGKDELWRRYLHR